MTPASPGQESQLIDEFARILGLSGWYEWRPDPGTHEISAATSATEGVSNPALLHAKQAAAVPYFLDALRRFEILSTEDIRTLAFEIALAGQNGLDYAKAEAAHTLKALPGERFTGLQLMCLMFAAFKRIAPDQGDLGMDLNEAFLTALELHQQRRDSQH